MSFVVRNRILLRLVLCAVVWLFKMFPVCLHLSYVGRDAVWSRAAHRQVEAGGCTCVGMLAKQLKPCKWSIILISLREQEACSLSPAFCLPFFLFFKSIPFPASSFLLMRRNGYGRCRVEATCHATSTHQVDPLLQRDAGIDGVFLNLFLWLNQDRKGPSITSSS